jgi:hypothetical protein
MKELDDLMDRLDGEPAARSGLRVAAE